MATLEKQTLDEIVRVIVEVEDPEQIVVFGSPARGEARAGSDIDLLIVERDVSGRAQSKRKRMAHLWRRLAGIPIAKDIVLCSRQEVDYWRDSLNNVVARAFREGKIVYDRSQKEGGEVP